MKDHAELRLHRAILALPPRPVCRDCADHNGTCQSKGKEPCDPYDALPMRIRALAAERDALLLVVNAALARRRAVQAVFDADDADDYAALERCKREAGDAFVAALDEYERTMKP